MAELTTLPQTLSQMVRGHSSPGFLPLDALGISISAYKNEVVIGPRDNGFPGPAAALDGPEPDVTVGSLFRHTQKAVNTLKPSALSYNYVRVCQKGILTTVQRPAIDLIFCT